MNNLSWSFYQIWNKSLEERKERELTPRSHIWATELGGAFIDRFLKMKAIPYTNPPNARSLRKFEAGNMMEWIAELVLRRAGVLVKDQEWLSYQYPECLEVTGKLDFLAGGKPDWEKAKAEIEQLNLPDFFGRATGAIISHFAEKYPDGLEKIVLEVKSCGSMMFDRYEQTGANDHHILQLFHYLKAKNMSEGHIVYISKDDLRMLEIGVFNSPVVEEKYKEDIGTMTSIWKSEKEPAKEPLVVFGEDFGKFSKNWRVEYSNYLTMLYGYKEAMDYNDEWGKKIARWNRVLTRCVNGSKMTKANLAIIEEIKAEFPNFEELVKKAKKGREEVKS